MTRRIPSYKRKNTFEAGDKHPGWKGDKAKHAAIHTWLAIHYGKAFLCENPECAGRSSHFDWALKKGFDYSHNREHYIMLCRACHIAYDWTDVRSSKLRDAMKKRKRDKKGRVI